MCKTEDTCLNVLIMELKVAILVQKGWKTTQNSPFLNKKMLFS